MTRNDRRVGVDAHVQGMSLDAPKFHFVLDETEVLGQVLGVAARVGVGQVLCKKRPERGYVAMDDRAAPSFLEGQYFRDYGVGEADLSSSMTVYSPR